MNHEELLARVVKLSITPETNVVPSELATALIAVIEIHKPFDSGVCGCEIDSPTVSYHYPCPTIRAIQERL
jgi:hypothetical protein